MRILFATSIKTWGGGEQWMLSAAAGLVARGHATVLAGRPGSAILDRAREAGIDTRAVAFAADVDPVSGARIWRICRARRIHALVLNMDRVLRVAGPAARLAGVRAVLPRRGSEFPLKDGWLYRWTYRHVATGVIVNSRATARTLTRDVAWRPAGEIHVLPNGLDCDRYARARPREETRAALGVPADAPVLLVVGELTRRKNGALLLEALPVLARAGHRPFVLFAGEGPEAEPLARRAAELGAADRVRILGFRRDVPDLLAAADLLVHPASVEGFGYAVAEAMAAGRAVVATDASSLPELVEPGRTGLLFPPGDGEALATAVEAYLRDPARRAEDGERGRERARREFALARRLDELEGILRAATGTRPGAASGEDA